MRQAGQVAILRFPHADLALGKPRPVLLIAPVPGPYEDWLVCMISTQLQQAVEQFDEVVSQDQPDFSLSGLKAPSVIRIARLGTDRMKTEALKQALDAGGYDVIFGGVRGPVYDDYPRLHGLHETNLSGCGPRRWHRAASVDP